MSTLAQGFEPVAESVGAARRYAVGALDGFRAEPLADEVRSVVSELATNAVLHAHTVFTVHLSLERRRLRIAVSDGSPAQPRTNRLRDPDSSTGRGLRIVAELSEAWGIEADGTGKTVWCELPLPGADRDPSGPVTG